MYLPQMFAVTAASEIDGSPRPCAAPRILDHDGPGRAL